MLTSPTTSAPNPRFTSSQHLPSGAVGERPPPRIRGTDTHLFLRAAVTQALLVAALFAALIALPLPDDFFEDYGWISGPVAWIACAAITARILSLPRALALFAAVAGGVAGAIVGIGLDHTAGLIVGIGVFAASSAGYETGGAATDAGS